MSDQILNKVIEIKSKEETKTKTGTNTVVKLTDQDGTKYVLFKKKKDGTLSSAAEQFKNMGLDEGSIMQISYVVDDYTDQSGQPRTSNKVIGFRETNEQPITGQSIIPAKQVVQKTTQPAKQVDVDWDEIAVGKCQYGFLQAFIQSGKSISDAMLQVTQARRLAELVVNGQTVTQAAEPLPTIQVEEDVNVDEIPF